MSAYKAKITSSSASASVSIAPPSGSIMAFLGSIDPDGWVICDGLSTNKDSAGNSVNRSNTDGKYNNLIANSIGSGTANSGNYTPPDYRGAFFRGAGRHGVHTSFSGEAYGAVQGDMNKSHSHICNLTWVYGTQTPGGRTFLTAETNGAIQTSIYGTTEVGGGESRPFNYSVNWILKL